MFWMTVENAYGQRVMFRCWRVHGGRSFVSRFAGYASDARLDAD